MRIPCFLTMRGFGDECSVQVAYHGEQYARAAIRFDGRSGQGVCECGVVVCCACVCVYVRVPTYNITLRAASGFHSSSRESPEKGSIGLNPRSGSELMDGTPYLC